MRQSNRTQSCKFTFTYTKNAMKVGTFSYCTPFVIAIARQRFNLDKLLAYGKLIVNLNKRASEKN